MKNQKHSKRSFLCLRDYKSRHAFLKEILRLIQDHEQHILDALQSDLGKPGLEAYLSEIYYTYAELKHAIKHLKRWMKPQYVRSPFYLWPCRSYYVHQAMGQVLIVSPWNYPFQLSMVPAISAWAAGNFVSIKPSEHVPMVNRCLREIAEKLNSPAFEVLSLDATETKKHLKHSHYDFVFFTGSRNAGQEVALATAEKNTPLALELGGKNPAIVSSEVKLQEVVRRLVLAKFFNAGQTCIAPDFVCVPLDKLEAFVSLFRAVYAEFYPPNRLEDHTRVLPHNELRILNLLESATGRREILGEIKAERLKAQLIVNPKLESPLMKSEVFGPVLPVLTYASPEDLDLILSKVPTPLALYVFSNNKKFVRQLAGQFPSAGMCINDAIKQISNPRLPFGGFQQSGYGAYHGKFGYQLFSQAKTVLQRSLWPDLFAVYPPYKDRLSSLRRFLK